MISRKLAEQFLTKLREETELFADVVDHKGIVQASLNYKLVGKTHKAALDFINSGQDCAELDPGQTDGEDTQCLILAIRENNVRVGALCMLGTRGSIRPAANMARLMLETMLECESKYESFQKYNSSRDIFNQALMYGENISKDILISRAEKLGIQPDCLRIAIFIVAEPKMDFSRIVQRSGENPMSSEQDIVAISRSSRIAVFKFLEPGKNLLSSYRYTIEEYLKWWRTELNAMGVGVQFNIGTMQNKLIRYREAYQHAVWLVTSAKCQDEINWFYDYTDQYLRSMVPNQIHSSIFQTYVEQMSPNVLAYYPELIGTLEDCNYNFIQASQRLFTHKNTTAFRLDKIRAFLNVNPVKNPKDRNFLNNLLYYLLHCN